MGDLSKWRNITEAVALFNASQRLYRSIGDTWGAARALEGLGLEMMISLDPVAAADYYQQAIALLGSTGSGKTSLVNLLPRFYDVTSGAVYLDGRNINDYPIHYLREQIGIVEQEPFLFSRTIRENIVYGVERVVSDEEVYEAARAAAIHDVILSFPLGYATLVGEKGVTLSGGQKQRVTIARTLLKNPRILVLDDSTSSVDLETEAEIRQALENLMKNRTTFIIAHRIQSIMNADLILVFDKGGIIQRGTHKQLIGVPGVYQQIYELQTNIDMELEKEVSRVRL
jgi:ATP-binding cassette subfamily B protein